MYVLSCWVSVFSLQILLASLRYFYIFDKKQENMNDNDFNRMKDDLLSAYQKSIRELPFLIEPFKQEFISDLEDVKEKGKAGIAELNQKLDEINVKGKITNGINLVKSKITESDVYKYIHSKSIELISKDKSKTY